MEAHAPARPAVPATGRNDRREIFGWTMYDWAISAFSTTVATVLLGPYLTSLAQRAVGENGVVLGLGPFGVTAKSLFPFCVAASVWLQVILLPVLGAIADYTHLKKRLLLVFTYAAVLATCLLFVVTGDLYLLGGLLFIVANVLAGAAVVIYNAFLPEISTEDRRDSVSSRGFALGYLGGGLLLAANLALVLGARPLGIASGLAVRLSLLSAGLWWGGFAVVTLTRLKARAAARTLPPGQRYLTAGLAQLVASMRDLARLPHTLRYLVGYMLYNDGIQTVISLSTVFLAQELFVAKGRPEADAQRFIIVLTLMVQFVAFAGALGFGRIAALLGTKRAIVLSLLIWCGVVVYAYGFLQTTAQALALGAVIALVLGGSQALSRSLFSRMIPAGREAAFFGLYEISERGTSWLGPLVFGIVVGATNSYRQAILSLIAFFILGTATLILTDTDRAVHEAGHPLPEEVGGAASAAA
jgi:MFS transporter, UMF1 family